jgi:polar amino acid transport system substrate-binding protein
MNMIPYTKWGTTLLVPAANPLGISCDPGDFDTCWAQMSGHTVAISKGGPQTVQLEAVNEMLVGKGLAPLDVQNFDGIVQADQALVNGQVDAVYEDDTHAHYFSTVTHPGMFTAAFTGRLPNELSLTTTIENTALAEAMQAALESMAADGSYQQIMENWGAIPLDAFPINPPREPAPTPTPAPSAP